MWAIIVLAILYCMSLGVHLAKHGEDRTDKYNFWLTLFITILDWWLLYCAGLFDKYL